MIGAMHHRGPDDSGMLEENNIVLGITRLAILDTGRGGHQPMLSPDGQIAIIYNGELYNFREERSLLEAVKLRGKLRGNLGRSLSFAAVAITAKKPLEHDSASVDGVRAG